jgi:hypothetical protein
MPAFVWNTNHRMWKVVPPFADSLAVLKAYITDPSAYVYWSTPRLHDEIAQGDLAFIYCTVDNQGMIARGVVEERPRQLTPADAGAFAFPDRLTPAGWDETVAPSPWKTGIRVKRTFWDAPLVAPGFRPGQGTVNRLTEAEVAAIEGEVVDE